MSAAAPTSPRKQASEQVIYLPDGTRLTADKALADWKKRAREALEARSPYEDQWRLNEAFAAGNQWLRSEKLSGTGTNRTLRDIRKSLNEDGRSIQEADVLTQYLQTALGKLAQDDFRPELLTVHDDAEGQDITSGLNDEYGWGWEQEWRGDQACLSILRKIVVYGTCGTRCRYDRTKGAFLGDFPHPTSPYDHTTPGEDGQPDQKTSYPAGRPILDRTAARAFTADRAQYGEPTNLKAVREGKIVWETMTPWNLLPPPGVDDPDDFPYDLIVRAVHIDALKSAYPDKASLIRAENVEQAGTIGSMSTIAPGSSGQLKDHALLYTGYLRPTLNYPRGMTSVWTCDTALELAAGLPYNGGPWGPRAGMTYFTYWPVDRRFFGRGLIEPMIGPQRTRNKRLSQMDEIIDRGLPKVFVQEGAEPDMTGDPMEIVRLPAGAPQPVVQQGIGPGPWMDTSLNRSDSDMQQASGLHDVSLGAGVPAGTPYAAIAQQGENDATKLGPIIQSFKLGICDLVRDTVEAMRQWPPGKRLMIEGDEGRLKVIAHDKSVIPDAYLVVPAKGGGLPRSQAAELQKITDLWQAALASGAVVQDSADWLDWYKTSLDGGQAQDLPEMSGKTQQQHKAALENVIMARLLEPVPVAPFDDAQIHIPIHDQQQAQFSEAAQMGDHVAGLIVQVIEQHKQAHLAMAAQSAQGAVPPGLPPGMAPPPQIGAPPPGPAPGPAPAPTIGGPQ